MNSSRVYAVLLTAVSSALYIAAIISFLTDNQSAGIACLCAGSGFLCFGSVFINNSVKNGKDNSGGKNEQNGSDQGENKK